MDGTFVHLLHADGLREWREMKVAALVKRLFGVRDLPAEWGTRLLSKPSAVYAFASIVGKEEFQEQVQKERRRLGVGGVSSALGDGAKWIWNIVRAMFGKPSECLDIFHALEHVASCDKTLYGEGACKNLVGCRLKQTGTCWRLERANKMALICAFLYADQWKRAWKYAN